MSYRASEDQIIYPLAFLSTVAGDPFGPYDIGGTDAETAWADMAEFDRVFGMIMLDTTFNAADAVDTIKLQQATSSSGAGIKDVTTSGSGATFNYDTSTGNVLKGAAKRYAIVECRAEDLDATNGFHYVRLYCAASGNTGTDNVKGFMKLYNAAHKKAALQGAPTANAALYISPTSAGGV